MNDSNFRTALIVLLFVLLAGIVFGLIWFFFLSSAPSSTTGSLGWYLFSFAAGLTMIVLPCTLPLAFVVVPLSLGKGPVKGFMIALSFGLGVAMTLSLYGVLAATLGKVAIGTLGAPLEAVKNWLYFIAGTLAYLFALGELKIVPFRMPTYSGALPGFIQKQQDVLKALLLGLFLGNIGVGCPHPATPVILTQIAVSGNVFYGWLLFFVHAIGRILPLLFLAILGILGINALSGLVKHKEKIERGTGWGMVFVAGFILILGLFSHDWWLVSGQHTYLEGLTQEEAFLTIIGQRSGATAPHHHGLPPQNATGLFGLPIAWGTYVLLFLWIAPFFWYYKKKKQSVAAVADLKEKEIQERTLPYLKWNLITLAVLLILIFGYVLPHRFLEQATAQKAEHMHMEEGTVPIAGHMMHGPSTYHEESDVKEGLLVKLVPPKNVVVGKETKLEFFISEQPGGRPVADLEIEHKKYIHLIGVRDDLNEFFHIHPESVLGKNGKPIPGNWTVSFTFNKPGTYKIWTDVKWRGETRSFGHSQFIAEGAGEKSRKEIVFATNVIVDDYQVGLHFDEPLVFGRVSELHFTTKDLFGKPVEMEPYLGADMHLTVLKDDLKIYIHTHPEGADHAHSLLVPTLINRVRAHGPSEESAGKEIAFRVTFPEVGIYKLFAQFRPKGINLPPDEALIAGFYVKVEATGAAKLSLQAVWWRNLIASLIAMAILSWAVKKYLTVKDIPPETK